MTAADEITIVPGQSWFEALVEYLGLPYDVADVIEDWILETTGEDCRQMPIEQLLALFDQFEAEH